VILKIEKSRFSLFERLCVDVAGCSQLLIRSLQFSLQSFFPNEALLRTGAEGDIFNPATIMLGLA
jgi:hypothetical protein